MDAESEVADASAVEASSEARLSAIDDTALQGSDNTSSNNNAATDSAITKGEEFTNDQSVNDATDNNDVTLTKDVDASDVIASSDIERLDGILEDFEEYGDEYDIDKAFDEDDDTFHVEDEYHCEDDETEEVHDYEATDDQNEALTAGAADHLHSNSDCAQGSGTFTLPAANLAAAPYEHLVLIGNVNLLRKHFDWSNVESFVTFVPLPQYSINDNISKLESLVSTVPKKSLWLFIGDLEMFADRIQSSDPVSLGYSIGCKTCKEGTGDASSEFRFKFLSSAPSSLKSIGEAAANVFRDFKTAVNKFHDTLPQEATVAFAPPFPYIILQFDSEAKHHEFHHKLYSQLPEVMISLDPFESFQHLVRKFCAVWLKHASQKNCEINLRYLFREVKVSAVCKQYTEQTFQQISDLYKKNNKVWFSVLFKVLLYCLGIEEGKNKHSTSVLTHKKCANFWAKCVRRFDQMSCTFIPFDLVDSLRKKVVISWSTYQKCAEATAVLQHIKVMGSSLEASSRSVESKKANGVVLLDEGFDVVNSNFLKIISEVFKGKVQFTNDCVGPAKETSSFDREEAIQNGYNVLATTDGDPSHLRAMLRKISNFLEFVKFPVMFRSEQRSRRGFVFAANYPQQFLGLKGRRLEGGLIDVEIIGDNDGEDQDNELDERAISCSYNLMFSLYRSDRFAPSLLRTHAHLGFVEPMTYKTKLCQQHLEGYTGLCEYYHQPGECRRTFADNFTYKPIMCTNGPGGTPCTNRICQSSHNKLEVMYHPYTFQSKICEGKCVYRQCCFMAHPNTPQMLLLPEWRDLHFNGGINALISLKIAMRKLLTLPHQAMSRSHYYVLYITSSTTSAHNAYVKASQWSNTYLQSVAPFGALHIFYKITKVVVCSLTLAVSMVTKRPSAFSGLRVLILDDVEELLGPSNRLLLQEFVKLLKTESDLNSINKVAVSHSDKLVNTSDSLAALRLLFGGDFTHADSPRQPEALVDDREASMKPLAQILSDHLPPQPTLAEKRKRDRREKRRQKKKLGSAAQATTEALRATAGLSPSSKRPRMAASRPLESPGRTEQKLDQSGIRSRIGINSSAKDRPLVDARQKLNDRFDNKGSQARRGGNVPSGGNSRRSRRSPIRDTRAPTRVVVQTPGPPQRPQQSYYSQASAPLDRYVSAFGAQGLMAPPSAQSYNSSGRHDYSQTRSSDYDRTDYGPYWNYSRTDQHSSYLGGGGSGTTPASAQLRYPSPASSSSLGNAWTRLEDRVEGLPHMSDYHSVSSNNHSRNPPALIQRQSLNFKEVYEAIEQTLSPSDVLAPSVHNIIQQARMYGCSTSQALQVFRNPSHISVLNMYLKKLDESVPRVSQLKAAPIKRALMLGTEFLSYVNQ